MSDFINKNTFEIRRSKHDHDYLDKPDWVVIQREYILPEVSREYLKWDATSNSVIEKSQEEKDAINAVATEAAKYATKSRAVIMSEIRQSFKIIDGDSETVQITKNQTKSRLINALDKYGSFASFLEVGVDGASYDLAREVMQKALTAGDITQIDYDFINGILPLTQE